MEGRSVFAEAMNFTGDLVGRLVQPTGFSGTHNLPVVLKEDEDEDR
jgi:hypothetical protein